MERARTSERHVGGQQGGAVRIDVSWAEIGFFQSTRYSFGNTQQSTEDMLQAGLLQGCTRNTSFQRRSAKVMLKSITVPLPAWAVWRIAALGGPS